MNTWMALSIIVAAFLESTVTHDHVLKGRLDLSVTMAMSDYGRHIVLHDACEIDNRTYLVGGATTLHSTAVGMDALLVVYEGVELVDVLFYGGLSEDQFTQVHCGSTLVVAGHSNSSDFLNVVGVNNFSRAFMMELDYQGNVLHQYVAEYAFESLIHGLDVSALGIVAVGQAKRITHSDFFIMHVTNHTMREHVFGGDGMDVLYDVHLGNHILVVGQTSSSEFNAPGPRGIQFTLNDDLSIQQSQLLLSSSQSAYHYVDSTYLAGTSSNQGIIQRRDERTVTIVKDSTILTGRYENIWYGATQKGGFVMDQPIVKGKVIAVMKNFMVLQQEGMLFEASLVVPHVFRHDDGNYFYNNQLLTFESVEFWDELVFHQQQVAYGGPFQLIVGSISTRLIPACNVQPLVYYHPVTLLCNTPFALNEVAGTTSMRLDQPGMYRLVIDEREVVFSIARSELPVIDVDYQTKQVIAIAPLDNRMWMIPAAWFGLFVGKKYLG
jgi:hypothetical protein